MSDKLFEITTDQLETGLRGYPCGYCTTSSVDPMKGLYYMGTPVSQMIDWKPEEVIYLLYFGKKPSHQELADFKKELVKRAPLKSKTLDALKKLPRDGHPMKLFSCALLIAGMFESVDDYYEDGLNVVAKMPEVVATLINYHAGWGDNRPSQPELGYIENFTQMLRVPHALQADLTEVMKLFNILHYDHDGGNLSTFVGKAVASGLADMYASLSASMDALSGPRHGRANQDCLHFVEEVLNELGETASSEQVENLIRKRLKENQLVFGFGHAVLRVEDPRATILFEVAQKKYPHHPLVKIALLLRDSGTKVLKENPKISDPYTNVDAISGSLLSAAGFPYPEYFTVLFGLSRCVGISRQIIYERKEAREGKGTPIVRPNYIFKGNYD